MNQFKIGINPIYVLYSVSILMFYQFSLPEAQGINSVDQSCQKNTKRKCHKGIKCTTHIGMEFEKDAWGQCPVRQKKSNNKQKQIYLFGSDFETVMPAKYRTIAPNIDLSQIFYHNFQTEDLLN